MRTMTPTKRPLSNRDMSPKNNNAQQVFVTPAPVVMMMPMPMQVNYAVHQ